MVSKEQAERDLSEYGTTLRACITYGWDRWQELDKVGSHLRAPLKTRTRANFISDHIVSEAVRKFSNKPGVRIHEQRGFLELVVRNRYVIRFKKLDSRGRSRNILTRTQRAWFEGQMSLPNMPEEAARLIAGYVLDMLGKEIQHVLVTCPVGTSGVEWMLRLDDDADLKIIEMPRAITPPKPPVIRSRKQKKETDDA